MTQIGVSLGSQGTVFTNKYYWNLGKHGKAPSSGGKSSSKHKIFPSIHCWTGETYHWADPNVFSL
jgi:hypothetical protein